MTATTTNLLDHLQEQGYEPDEAFAAGGAREDWFDLTVSGIGTVRVVLNSADGHRAEVHAFGSRMICKWSAEFSPGTPDAVILATIEAAEQELAVKRGGPVTPAQTRTA